MTMEIRRTILNFIIWITFYMPYPTSLKIVSNSSGNYNVNKPSCFGHDWFECHDWCLKIVKVGMTHRGKNINLNLFEVCSEKYAFIESAT